MSMTQKEALNELLTMLARYAFDVDEAQAIGKAMEALRPFSRERIEKAWRGGWIAIREVGCDPIGGYIGSYKCSWCNEEAVLDCNDEFVLDNFCPRCGAAMTDEAVEIIMRRLEALYENRD